MPPIGRSTLVMANLGTALLGQIMLPTSPKAGIVILGISLAIALIEGWWYLAPLRTVWFSFFVLAILGLYYLSEPRGWFFLAWALIELGTSWRAQVIMNRYAEAMAEWGARSTRTEETEPEEEEGRYDLEAASDQAAADLPERPYYPLAFLFGLPAAAVGALAWFSIVKLIRWDLDLFSWLVGLMVGRAVLKGAGGRSSLPLQLMAALLGCAGMLAGRYLLIRDRMVEKGVGERLTEGQTFETFLTLVVTRPVESIGIFGLIFLAVGVWAAWQGARQR